MATDILADPFAPGQDSPIGATQINTNIFPWEDLNAQNIPETFPLIAHDIIPTLSVLTATRGNVPRLVQYDEAGRALATGDRVAQDRVSVPPVQLNNIIQALEIGTESVELKFVWNGAADAGGALTLIGLDTGFVYYNNIPITGNNATIQAQVDASQDSKVSIGVQNNSALTPVTVFITLVKAVDEVTILTNPGQEPTFKAMASPLGWQGPNKLPAYFDTVAAGTFVVVSADITKTLNVWGVNFDIRVAGAGFIKLQDTLGNNLAVALTDNIRTVPIPLYGAPLAKGSGLQLVLGGPGLVRSDITYASN